LPAPSIPEKLIRMGWPEDGAAPRGWVKGRCS
jgi:hypothetical protein